MLQTTIDFLSSPFTEIIILVILLISFFTLRKDPRLVVSGVRLIRTLTLIVIFFYLMFVWVSAIRPALSAISIFGMFIINLIMFFNLILARLERPYRDALNTITKEPENHELIHNVWNTGKRFYYFRYFWSALFSGANPIHFLHDLAIDRVRDDIKDTLHHFGVEKKMITLPMMAGYLLSQLATDETLPADFKDLMQKNVDNFAKHPWIQEQGNEFLRLVTERPEDLHFPEWMSKFESYVNNQK